MYRVKYQLLKPGAKKPSKAHDTDAGFDMFVCNDTAIWPNEVVDVPTGISLQMEESMWAMITGRSSTIRKRGLLVTTGIIDPGYRGELFFAVYNPTPHYITIKAGDRLSQLLFFPNLPTSWTEVELLDDSARGEHGFGSTGH